MATSLSSASAPSTKILAFTLLRYALSLDPLHCLSYIEQLLPSSKQSFNRKFRLARALEGV